MNLLECIKEMLRPELKVQDEIIERERQFSLDNLGRKNWIMGHVYLCKGDLKELEQNPHYRNFGIAHVWAYFAGNSKRTAQHKKVRVSIEKRDNETETMKMVEEELKMALYLRGANAGVFYRQYEKRNRLFAEAVPAILTSE
jgi:UDP-N-acetylmuramoylalanine-D-glutamate ligase